MATSTTQKAKSTPKKKKDLKIDFGVLHVQTTDNNTIITLVDENGNKII